MKVKEFQDAEFRIVGCDEGVGQDAGTPIWRCEISPGGPQFSARMMGTLENRRLMWQRRAEYIGEMLTVKFFEYTNDGIPRFPNGVAIRNYE
jgi:DNA ligase-1